MSTNQSIAVYGPQGCGKTQHAERMAKYFGLTEIIDEPDPMGHIKLLGVLYLTQGPLLYVRSIPFNDVLRMCPLGE